MTEVEVLNQTNIKTAAFEKKTILDIKATDDKGRMYNIWLYFLRNEGKGDETMTILLKDDPEIAKALSKY